MAVRRAGPDDSADVARLLHQFNLEFSDPSPGVDFLTSRVAELIDAEELIALLVGDGPEGVAVLRFRPALWGVALDAYLEELYVVPRRRGEGLGRALLEAAIEAARERGADRIELGTSTDDVAARGLYESAGFTNREGGPDGPAMLFYERDL